jgi:hypothetical protein
MCIPFGYFIAYHLVPVECFVPKKHPAVFDNPPHCHQPALHHIQRCHAVLQGTFEVIQGTFDIIKGTFEIIQGNI